MKFLKRFLIVLFIIAIIVAAIWRVLSLREKQIFPIETVKIKGNFSPQDKTTLKNIILPAIQTNFFKIRLKTLQAMIQQLPWVLHAEVERIWPAEIIIHIAAQQAVARWNKNKMLNAYGEIFQTNLLSRTQLPQFFGPNKAATQMLSYYQQMNEMLLPLQLTVVAMTFDADQFWRVKLSNGLQLQLGHSHVLTRLRHFVAVYPKVFGKTTRRAKQVDLQYENGMAVQW